MIGLIKYIAPKIVRHGPTICSIATLAGGISNPALGEASTAVGTATADLAQKSDIINDILSNILRFLFLLHPQVLTLICPFLTKHFTC